MKRKSTGRTAKYRIESLCLKPHPEGGWFRETYRSNEKIAKTYLPKRYGSKRAFGTAIYFLLKGGQFSAFHRLKSDEIWHFYDGAPVAIFIIQKSGALKKIKLGLNPEAGEQPQVVIKANSWFAAALAGLDFKSHISNRKSAIENPKSFVLLGCTVAPGFDFSDFELGRRAELIKRFPHQRRLIERFTQP